MREHLQGSWVREQYQDRVPFLAKFGDAFSWETTYIVSCPNQHFTWAPCCDNQGGWRLPYLCWTLAHVSNNNIVGRLLLTANAAQRACRRRL